MKNGYVVEIRNADNNELIGYHLSTMGQITQDKHQAKRYGSETTSNTAIQHQLSTIYDNIKTRFKNRDEGVYPREGLQGAFDQVTMAILEKYYVGVDDVRLHAIALM